MTSALVDRWIAAALGQVKPGKGKGQGKAAGGQQGEPSLGAVRQLIKAYRLACHYGDPTADEGGKMRITSTSVYNKLMIFMLKVCEAWHVCRHDSCGLQCASLGRATF